MAAQRVRAAEAAGFEANLTNAAMVLEFAGRMAQEGGDGLFNVALEHPWPPES